MGRSLPSLRSAQRTSAPDSTKQVTSPSFPRRAVRPAECTKPATSLGISKSKTCRNRGKSSPRAAAAVHTSARASPEAKRATASALPSGAAAPSHNSAARSCGISATRRPYRAILSRSHLHGRWRLPQGARAWTAAAAAGSQKIIVVPKRGGVASWGLRARRLEARGWRRRPRGATGRPPRCAAPRGGPSRDAAQ